MSSKWVENLIESLKQEANTQMKIFELKQEHKRLSKEGERAKLKAELKEDIKMYAKDLPNWAVEITGKQLPAEEDGEQIEKRKKFLEKQKCIEQELEAAQERVEAFCDSIHAQMQGKPCVPEFSQKLKADKGKDHLTLVPLQILHAITKVREFGVKKYGSVDSWKKVEPERYKDAAFRHWLAYLENPDSVDDESGLSPLWHCACNIAFLIALEDSKNEAN